LQLRRAREMDAGLLTQDLVGLLVRVFVSERLGHVFPHYWLDGTSRKHAKIRTRQRVIELHGATAAPRSPPLRSRLSASHCRVCVRSACLDRATRALDAVRPRDHGFCVQSGVLLYRM